MKELIKSLLFDIEERLNVAESNIALHNTNLEISKNTYNELKYFQNKIKTILENSDKIKESERDKVRKYTFNKSLEEMCEDLGDRLLEIIDKDSFDLETKEGLRRIVRGQSFFYNIDTKEFLYAAAENEQQVKNISKEQIINALNDEIIGHRAVLRDTKSYDTEVEYASIIKGLEIAICNINKLFK